MAETYEAARTEEPTPKRLEEARRRGDVPVGRGATLAAALAGALAAVVLTAGAGFAAVARLSRTAWGGPVGDPLGLLREGGWVALGWVAPVLLAALVAGVLVGLVQTRGLFTLQGLRGSLRWRFAPHPWNAVRSVLFVAGSIAIVALFSRSWFRTIAMLPRATPAQALEALGTLALTSCGALAGLAALGGALDVLAHRWFWRRRMRMTRRELQRERRESEGDAWLAEERRRAHRELAGS